MHLIKNFTEVSRHDAAIAGGKGASLGEMTTAGIPVPPGFVVLAGAFEQFLKETDLLQDIDAILHTVDQKEMHTIEHASEKIQGLILAAAMPEDIEEEIKKQFKELDAEFVAVRSSATAEDSASAAWAGQLDSFLNTDESTLLQNVQRCWASLFTPRAIFYRFEKELHLTKISVAVVVQKMVQSEVSGIAFSVHPVTEDRNQLIIEAGFGLGEAIVSGQVTPDSYVVEKEPRRIIDINVSTQTRALYHSTIRAKRRIVDSEETFAEGHLLHGQGKEPNEWIEIPEPKASSQVLTEKQILELSEIILKIENHYSFPCDIEWAFEEGKFYIVQSRPITTLANSTPANATYKSTDYYFLFQTYGISLLFTDICSHYYGEFNTATLSLDGQYRYYVSLKDMETTKHTSQDMYKDTQTVLGYATQFGSAKKELDTFRQTLLSGKGVDKNDFEYFVTRAATMLNEYAKFDHVYTDNLFTDTCEHVEEIIALIAEKKNVMREGINAVFFNEDSCLFVLLDKITKQYGIPNEQLHGATMDEVRGMFEGTKIEPKDGGDYAIIRDNNVYINYVGVEATKFLKEFIIETDITGTTQLTGISVAAKGTYKGAVKKVSIDYMRLKESIAELKDFKEGSILVTDSTVPEMVPIMSKALAIVTDMGGMLSHAEISSRELGKPCVIGTKVATRLLTDGDMVEVDANAGTVTILEKAHE